jgi:hypothetical protein
VGGVNAVFPDERGALFVDPRDLAGIAAGLKQLSESAELRQKLAATSQASKPIHASPTVRTLPRRLRTSESETFRSAPPRIRTTDTASAEF